MSNSNSGKRLHTLASSESPANAPSVVVIGGGLSGIAAAWMLRQNGFQVRVLEAKRKLGGRAGSYTDPVTGEAIDYCQHVGLGCCTELIRLLRELDLYQFWKRERTLNFCGPSGERISFAAAPWVPAPLHLWPLLNAWPGLTFFHRMQIARAIVQMRLTSDHKSKSLGNVLPWLEARGQSPEVIDRFWTAILVSALGDQIDRVAFSAARKVILDGFVKDAHGYELLVPSRSLSEIFGDMTCQKLRDAGVQVDLQSSVKSIGWQGDVATHVTTGAGELVKFDYVVCAIPWFRLNALLAKGSEAEINTHRAKIAQICDAAQAVKGAPISGCHLWFDKPWLKDRQVAIIGRLSQWVFQREDLIMESQPMETTTDGSTGYYYQVVISGSRELPSDSQVAIDMIVADLRELFPSLKNVSLIKGKVVTDPLSVYSLDAETESRRPEAGTWLGNIVLAGDWTQTGWPATMEGAIRSGLAAAENIIMS